jgi:signal transduction histidine kinase
MRENGQASLRDCRRLIRLLDELLDLTRIRLGKLEIRPERCDLASIANDAVAQFGAEAARHGSALKLDATGPVRGSFDPVRSAQIFTNLISNAIKYGAGHPIRVALEEKPENWVEIRVSDQGPGIPPELQSRIFERFERAAPRGSATGLGLGLYITRQIVRGHGGELSVESVPGQGSTFIARIPREPLSKPTDHRPGAPERSAPRELDA